MELSLKEALLPKQEEPKTKTKTWKHWTLACLCLVLSCLNAACFVYASCVQFSLIDALRASSTIGNNSKTYDHISWKELLYLGVVPFSVIFGLFIQFSFLYSILRTKSQKHSLKALYEPNPDGSQGDSLDIGLFDSHYLGTDLYKEVAWDYTQQTFNFCAIVYAFAFFLEVFFHMFEASRPFSVALIIIFSAALALSFVKSFILNTKIALRLGE